MLSVRCRNYDLVQMPDTPSHTYICLEGKLATGPCRAQTSGVAPVFRRGLHLGASPASSARLRAACGKHLGLLDSRCGARPLTASSGTPGGLWCRRSAPADHGLVLGGSQLRRRLPVEKPAPPGGPGRHLRLCSHVSLSLRVPGVTSQRGLHVAAPSTTPWRQTRAPSLYALSGTERELSE